LSIVQIQELFQKKGCQVVLGIVALFVMVGLLITGQCAGMTNAAQGPDTESIVTLDGNRLTYSEYQSLVDRQAEQASQQFNGMQLPQAYLLIQRPQILTGAVRLLAFQSMAKAKGVKVDEASVTAFLEMELDRQINAEKATLIQEGKLKKDADQAAFEKAFKDKFTRTPAEIKTEQVNQIKTQFKNNATEAIRSQTPLMLMNQITAGIKISDEELKASFDNFSVEAMAFSKPDMPEDEREKKAEEAKAALAGGKAWADVAKQMAITPETSTFSRSEIEAQENVKPLLSLKAGQVSDVLMTPNGPTIYRVTKIENKLPSDFEANKESLRRTMAQGRAADQLKKEADALIASDKVKWNDKAMKLLYDLGIALEDPKMQSSAAERKSRMQAFEAEAVKLAGGTELGAGFAPQVRLIAQQMYWNDLTDQEKSTLRKDRIEALEDFFTYSEDSGFRLELYDLFMAESDKENAAQQLAAAVDSGIGYDAMGQQQISEIRGKLFEAESNKRLEPEQLEIVKKALNTWAANKAEFDKEQTAIAEEQAKIDAEMEAERKKMEEEDKAAGNAPVNPAPTNPAPSNP